MNESTDLPEKRPMPEALRDRLWEDIEPQLEPPESRFRSMRAPLAVAASVVVLAAAVAITFSQLRGQDVGVAAGPDSQLVKECVQADHDVPTSGGSWRSGARIDLDSKNGFVAIRNDQFAAVCVIQNGKGVGIMGGDVSTGHVYANLTAARPFDYLGSMNYPDESIHFGIAADNVAAVSVVGPDNVELPATLRNGTFVVRSKIGENSDQTTTNYVRATMADGHVVGGPFRF